MRAHLVLVEVVDPRRRRVRPAAVSCCCARLRPLVDDGLDEPPRHANVGHACEPVPRHPDVYPGLGMTAMLKTYGNPPPFPVSGPSAPISGSRPTGITDNPFPGLSMQLASYNYNRTCAIMAGARAGC